MPDKKDESVGFSAVRHVNRRNVSDQYGLRERIAVLKYNFLHKMRRIGGGITIAGLMSVPTLPTLPTPPTVPTPPTLPTLPTPPTVPTPPIMPTLPILPTPPTPPIKSRNHEESNHVFSFRRLSGDSLCRQHQPY